MPSCAAVQINPKFSDLKQQKFISHAFCKSIVDLSKVLLYLILTQLCKLPKALWPGTPVVTMVSSKEHDESGASL